MPNVSIAVLAQDNYSTAIADIGSSPKDWETIDVTLEMIDHVLLPGT